jgi:diphthamide synthase (EF-2-diphthine--ammonia ligase)
MVAAFASIPLRDVDEIAFGDLFLEDIRAYRESRLAADGKRGQFPLWGRDTHELAHRFLADGFRAIVRLRRSAPARSLLCRSRVDERLLADLPPNVDPCGENGEFHTFVYAGPIFSLPLRCRRGATVERDGFVFCDLLEQGA